MAFMELMNLSLLQITHRLDTLLLTGSMVAFSLCLLVKSKLQIFG
jgi:hypothetical protein